MNGEGDAGEQIVLDSPLATKFPHSCDNFQTLLDCESLEKENATPDAVAGPEAGVMSEPVNGKSSSLTNGASVKEERTVEDEQTPSTAQATPLHTPPTGGGLVAQCTLFENIQYLGCSKIDDPANEAEMLKVIKVLDEEPTAVPISVSLAVPRISTGTVSLCESALPAGPPLASFPLPRVRFCVRGRAGERQAACFAFTFTHNEINTQSSAHQCHVFRLAHPEAAGRALFCFSQAFKNTGRVGADCEETRLECRYEGYLELREEESKSKNSDNYVICPQQKDTFKIRRDRDKKIVVQLKQVDGHRLSIKKCFGMLLAAGKNLRHSDMQLLDMESMSRSSIDPSVYTISAHWDPRQNFEVLNIETPRDTRVFMTVCVDVIMAEVNEPIRFKLECKVRVVDQHDSYLREPRLAIREGYFLTLEKSCDPQQPSLVFVSLESNSDRLRQKSPVGRSPSKMPAQLIHPAGDDESDCEEPLLSGSGEVNRECAEGVLEEWRKAVEKWKQSGDGSRPSELAALMHNGIPDVLRGEVWRMLSKVHLDADLPGKYHELLLKECPSEQVIMRDIHRTFPAHDFFKEAGGKGQDGLYKISAAYSLYDEEVSYCQGLSFLAASLLLHMSEEEAFCVLVKIMYDYQLRDLFKLGFDSLHLRFYQLDCLIKEYEMELWRHFEKLGVETHMYASQWFLTLFTAKFPLQMVFFIIDLFLTEGMNTIFHISLALLRDSKQDLLSLDFEGILKYFRVSLPRKYRSEAAAKALIHRAVKMKLSHKRLARYEKEYAKLKEQERDNMDPLKRFQRENAHLLENTHRLERENDDLAHELVTSKIELRRKLDTLEDNYETSLNTIERLTRLNQDQTEEIDNLNLEKEQVKEMFRREVEKAQRLEKLVEEFKNINKETNRRAEKEKQQFQQEKKTIVSRISQCDVCWPAVQAWEQNRSPVHTPSSEMSDLLTRMQEQEVQLHTVEQELIQTKVALAEEQCKNHDLTHQLAVQLEQPDSGRKWLKKTISHIKEVGTSLKSHERSNSTVSVQDR